MVVAGVAAVQSGRFRTARSPACAQAIDGVVLAGLPLALAAAIASKATVRGVLPS
jgi:hypothetical protein